MAAAKKVINTRTWNGPVRMAITYFKSSLPPELPEFSSMNPLESRPISSEYAESRSGNIRFADLFLEEDKDERFDLLFGGGG